MIEIVGATRTRGLQAVIGVFKSGKGGLLFRGCASLRPSFQEVELPQLSPSDVLFESDSLQKVTQPG